ncbi:hypothetical protein ACH4TC_18540 [Streptomyces spororaveus]|uniref:hypothetical protein n=1 Tax=Streptomyces spororaveus TaxID=284039 RepID=UPI0037A8195D
MSRRPIVDIHRPGVTIRVGGGRRRMSPAATHAVLALFVPIIGNALYEAFRPKPCSLRREESLAAERRQADWNAHTL